MDSSRRVGGDNWLRDFVAGAVEETRPEGSTTASPALPPAWMELIEGPSPGQSIGSIGPYRIDERIGRGGMGVVYQAFDSALRRVVAVKFLSPRLAVSPVARLRFAREAQAAAAINHPNIVTIHAIGEYEGLPYLVMEYVAGITLADRLQQEGMLERKSILRIGIQIARGLAAAHAQGLIHRDVKPANILLESGLDRVKITDFGLACVMAEPWRLTASGALLGTPPYMSPEQAASAALDHRSDLFSLGSVLYHLCTGEPPFPGPTIKAVLTGVRESEPRPIRDLNPEIPPALEDHIRRSMAKDPADRFSSASELVRALVDELAAIQGKGTDPSLDEPECERPARERPRPVAPGGRFEIVETCDAPTPPAKQAAPAGTAAASGRSIWWLVLPAVGIATAVAVAAVAIVNRIPSWRQDHGEETPIIVLLAFTGLAVVTWGLARLLAAVRGHRAADTWRRRLLLLLRNSLATAVLLLVAGIAYKEWATYSEANRAINALTLHRFVKRDNPPNRKEIEALIRCAGEEISPGDMPGPMRVIYRWKGFFRSYVLQVDYVMPTNRTGRLGPRPPGYDRGTDVLYWMNDVLE